MHGGTDRLLLPPLPETCARSLGLRRLHGGDLPRVRISSRIGRRIGSGLSLLALAAMLAGCGARPTEPKSLGYAYTGPASLNLRSDLGLNGATTATVQHGSRLEILEKKRKFVRVRTATGTEGWADSTLLLTQAQMDDLQKLAAHAEAMPSQAVATVFDKLNVHAGPDRTSASFTQVNEGDDIDVLAHRVSTRVVDGETRPLDDWFLIRAEGGSTGWVLSRNLLMKVPDEIVQYASGQYITAYKPLAELRNPATGDSKTVWLWTTSVTSRLPYDFDGFRIFFYNWKRNRWETSYSEHELKGHYPVELVKPDGQTPGFSVVVEANDGSLVKKTYSWNAPLVKLVSKVPTQPQPPIPELGGPSKEKQAPATESWTDRVKTTVSGWFGGGKEKEDTP